MWTVMKYERRYLGLLKSNFIKKFGKDCIFYNPKIKLDFFFKNKIITREKFILKDYIFCFSKNFENKNILAALRNTKGLKYLLNGFQYSQNDLKEFIEHFKSKEDSNGFVDKNFVKMILNKTYVFKSGPFMNNIFKLLNFSDQSLEILMGNIKTKILRDKFLIESI